MKKKLAVWKSKSLSIGGRTTLIGSSLSNSFVYHISMYLLPKLIGWTGKGCFLLARGWAQKKYHLVEWDIINKSKKYGGLGIKNIQIMNISLLSKWWWKLERDSGNRSLKKSTYIGTLLDL